MIFSHLMQIFSESFSHPTTFQKFNCLTLKVLSWYLQIFSCYFPFMSKYHILSFINRYFKAWIISPCNHILQSLDALNLRENKRKVSSLFPDGTIICKQRDSFPSLLNMSFSRMLNREGLMTLPWAVPFSTSSSSHSSLPALICVARLHKKFWIPCSILSPAPASWHVVSKPSFHSRSFAFSVSKKTSTCTHSWVTPPQTALVQYKNPLFQILY